VAVRLEDGEFDSESLRVLVADTDQTFIQQALGCLGAAHHQVEFTSDGLDALNLALTRRYHVVIVAVDLPRVSGLNVLRTLRTESATEALVLFAIASPGAEAHDKSVFDAYRCGADICLTKPIECDELVRFVTVVGRNE
jgi:DNA-binding response OmpR family regulator